MNAMSVCLCMYLIVVCCVCLLLSALCCLFAVQEMKESPLSENIDRGVAEVKKAAKHVCDQTVDVCKHWRHYPGLVTILLLTSSMLLGAGLTAGVTKLGGFGGRNVTTQTHAY